MISLRQLACRLFLPLIAFGVVLNVYSFYPQTPSQVAEKLFKSSSGFTRRPKDFAKTSGGLPRKDTARTKPVILHSTVTSVATVTVTATASVTVSHTVSHTVTATETPKPPGPAFCDACGSHDTLCSLYGEHNLARSRAYEGANARFRRVIANALDGKPTKIGVLGGSVTASHGLRSHNENWAVMFTEAWKGLFPKSTTTLFLGAVPATGSDYFSMCYRQHIPDDVDLVIIELHINDQRIDMNSFAYEWLARGLLALPNRPAILNIQTIGLFYETIAIGGDLHIPVAVYYDIPIISVRNLLLPQILEHSDLEQYYFTSMGDGSVDLRHVNFRGHKIMADLLVAYTQRQICMTEKEKANPSTFSPDRTIPGTDKLETIPRLRMFQKYDREAVVDHITPTCQTIRANSLNPIENTGWREWAYRDKTYLIATDPGSRVRFEVVTSAIGRVRITYLRSKHFGLGNAWCWLDDDRKQGKSVVSWWQLDNINVASVTTIAEGLAPGKHILSCEVTEETGDPGGGHEFRLIAVDSA